MGKKETYEQKTEQLLEPLLAEKQFELVDVEYVKEGSQWYLRAYIDKDGGITVEDCETVSNLLGDLLDQHDFIPNSYILEVSSPGLCRQLKKEKDFARSLGKKVEVKLYQAIANEKTIIGVLQSYDAESITLQMQEKGELQLHKKDIAMIRLAFEF